MYLLLELETLRESLAQLNRRFIAPSPCETAPEASVRHHWQYRRPAAGYQLTTTASTRFVPSMSPLQSLSVGLLPTSVYDSADLFSVTVLENG